MSLIYSSLNLSELCLYFHDRRENAELKLSVQDQGDVILGLRKDLEGATARLSDISGNTYFTLLV